VIGQCVYITPSRFEGPVGFVAPTIFANDVTIIGSEANGADPTNFSVEGNVDTAFFPDRTFVVGTETLFSDNVFIGDDTNRPSRPGRENDPSLYIDGDLVVGEESFFQDDVTIDRNAKLLVEGDLEVEGDADIDVDIKIDIEEQLQNINDNEKKEDNNED
jgi:hypothetical protein